MRTPISYYGGKQNLVDEILPLIPEHVQYVEPFFGGGAVFFAKKPSKNEVINDLDKRVSNFYEVMKTDFDSLHKKVISTLHSEIAHTEAAEILKEPIKDKLNSAWAFWVQTNMSFGNRIFAGFAFSTIGGQSNSTAIKRDEFKLYENRLECCEIFCRDAINLIEQKDSIDTLFYCDPPYVSSDQGHYKGYNLEDFSRLLITLSNIKGKFILSSYPEKVLMEARKKYQWFFEDIKQVLQVTQFIGDKKKNRFKTECLTWNFQRPNQQLEIL